MRPPRPAPLRAAIGAVLVPALLIAAGPSAASAPASTLRHPPPRLADMGERVEATSRMLSTGRVADVVRAIAGWDAHPTAMVGSAASPAPGSTGIAGGSIGRLSAAVLHAEAVASSQARAAEDLAALGGRALDLRVLLADPSLGKTARAHLLREARDLGRRISGAAVSRR